MTTNVNRSTTNQSVFSRIRRNHGLEHATIHILSRRLPKMSLAGYSDSRGFWLLGDIPTEEVRPAVEEALRRLRAGEKDLAIHPNCGTNFVTAGSVAGIAAAAAMLTSGRRWQDKLERVPLAMTVATFGLMLAQPLGFFLQEHVTTSGDPGGMEIMEIIPTRRGRLKAHRVLTRR
ncbi:MAG TPA: DUF6391 domain-containing protein [Anaerolineales bacterium]|nr:DUF6391 domain-containing protein [Anaerolineales bacterium]